MSGTRVRPFGPHPSTDPAHDLCSSTSGWNHPTICVVNVLSGHVQGVMRHSDCATTEKHYGALRSAPEAADEVQSRLAAQNPSFVVGESWGDGKQKAPQHKAEELLKRKTLRNSLERSTPGGSRTPNPRLRRPMLYPIELRMRHGLQTLIPRTNRRSLSSSNRTRRREKQTDCNAVAQSTRMLGDSKPETHCLHDLMSVEARHAVGGFNQGREP